MRRSKQDGYARDTQIKGELADHDAKMRTYEASEKVKAIQLETQQKAQKHEQDMQPGALDVRKKELEVRSWAARSSWTLKEPTFMPSRQGSAWLSGLQQLTRRSGESRHA